MERKDFTFFVKRHEIRKTHKGTKYALRLETAAGHYLVFKSDSESLFDGFPIDQAVGVKLGNPQTTFARGGEHMEEEESEEEEKEEEEE